jgi:putative oxidoreductase
MINDVNDEVILAARVLLAALFLIFGCRKLRDVSGTVSQMVQEIGPMPILATAVSIFMELPVAFAVAVGAFTRPSAALMALYTLGTALVGHHYWTVKGADYVDSLEGFYKDLSIMGGSCCCPSPVGENIQSMHGAASPRHSLWANHRAWSKIN